MIDAIIPPSTVNPIVLRATAPAPVASTIGMTPKIKAMEVMMIGLKRKRTASIVDCHNSSPLSTRIFANSTMRIAFFADKSNQGDQSDLRVYIICQRRHTGKHKDSPKSADRNSEHNRKWHGPTFIQCSKKKKNKNNGKNKYIDSGCSPLLFLRNSILKIHTYILCGNTFAAVCLNASNSLTCAISLRCRAIHFGRTENIKVCNQRGGFDWLILNQRT